MKHDKQTEEIAAYVEARNTALLGSLQTFMAFAASQGHVFSDELAAEISMHKLRTSCKGLPRKLRRRSYFWLRRRGMEPWDDGDLAKREAGDAQDQT